MNVKMIVRHKLWSPAIILKEVNHPFKILSDIFWPTLFWGGFGQQSRQYQKPDGCSKRGICAAFLIGDIFTDNAKNVRFFYTRPSNTFFINLFGNVLIYFEQFFQFQVADFFGIFWEFLKSQIAFFKTWFGGVVGLRKMQRSFFLQFISVVIKQISPVYNVEFIDKKIIHGGCFNDYYGANISIF